MEPTSQIKDSRGEIRVKSVSCSAIGADDVAPSLIFQPRPNSSCKSEDELDEHRAPVRLEDLAFINASQLLNIAKAIGPLFGDSLVENVLTWQDAANIANAAIRIQEVANGRKPPMQLNGRKRGPESTPPLVVKSIIKDARSSRRFSVFALSQPLASSQADAYRRHLPPMPWSQRFQDKQEVDYSLVTIERDEDIDYLTITLISFKKMVSPADFSAILQTFYQIDPAQSDRLAGNAKQGERSPLLEEGRLTEESSLIDGNDEHALARLVQVIASVHLQNVRVDVFRSNESDDFLRFDTRLSYLWYRFAKGLGNVKIGYCQQCGKAFSLAGHRGIPRRFCSQACKTQAKNNRTKAARDKARALFLEGETIESIAPIAYPSLSARFGTERVRKDLSTWVELKHRTKHADTEEDRDLLARSIAEGIFDSTRARKQTGTATNRKMTNE